MKDSILNHLGKKTKSEKDLYYVEWAKQPCLMAAREIANTAKHFFLRKGQKTKAVKASSTCIVNFYEDDQENVYKEFDENAPDYKVILDNGEELSLHEFTDNVMNYWRGYLSQSGIDYKKQDPKVYFGIEEK